MKDALGRWLEEWRIRTVFPHVRGRLLDVGCGMNQLVRRYRNGIGVDVHQWGDVDIVVNDSSRLPFGNAEFDTVTILAALNHIPNRESALLEAFRVLRPGGTLVVTMIPPALSRAWHALRRPWDVDQTERGMKPGEVYGLARVEVRRLIEVAGFRIERASGFMLGINTLTVASRPASAPQRDTRDSAHAAS